MDRIGKSNAPHTPQHLNPNARAFTPGASAHPAPPARPLTRPTLPPINTQLGPQRQDDSRLPISPEPILRNYVEYAKAHENIAHPNVFNQPPGPRRESSPNTSAFTHVAGSGFASHPQVKVNELGYSGQPSPGGTNFVLSQKEPDLGGTDSVTVNMKSGDTHVAHTHPDTFPKAGQPSALDSHVMYQHNSNPDNPQVKSLVNQPSSGIWNDFEGKLDPKTLGPQFNPVVNPYRMDPIKTNNEGYPQVRIPTEADRIAPPPGPSGIFF